MAGVRTDRGSCTLTRTLNTTNLDNRCNISASPRPRSQRIPSPPSTPPHMRGPAQARVVRA